MSIQCWRKNIPPCYRFAKGKDHSAFPDPAVGAEMTCLPQLHMAVDLLLASRGKKKPTPFRTAHYYGLIVLCMGSQYTLGRDADCLLVQVLTHYAK